METYRYQGYTTVISVEGEVSKRLKEFLKQASIHSSIYRVQILLKVYSIIPIGLMNLFKILTNTYLLYGNLFKGYITVFI